MASKRQRKKQRRAGNEKLRAAQRAGRPKQEGDRYPCGKLKPRKNERVIEAKKALVGEKLDIALAEDPLDFIHAKGWLSTPRYHMALSYRDARRRAHVGAPGVSAGGVEETASTTGIEGRLGDMTDAEITAVFDHVFRDPPVMTAEEREAKAFQRWSRMERAMTPAQSREVSLIAVQASWAFWITALNAGKDLDVRRAQQRQDFEEGLDAMRRALQPPPSSPRSGPSASIHAIPDPGPQKIVENLRFVDEDGHPVEMVGQTGRRFAVARKVSR